MTCCAPATDSGWGEQPLINDFNKEAIISFVRRMCSQLLHLPLATFTSIRTSLEIKYFQMSTCIVQYIYRLNLYVYKYECILWNLIKT